MSPSFVATLVLALLVGSGQTYRLVKRQQFDNSKPLDANNFGIDNPIFVAAIHSINIGINAVLNNGDSLTGVFTGRLTKIGDDLKDAVENLRTLVTPPPTTPETLADTLVKLRKIFEDIDDIFNQARTAGLPIDSLPPVIVISSALKIAIPAIQVAETGLRVGGAVGNEFQQAT